MNDPCAWRIRRPDDPEDLPTLEATMEDPEATCEPLLQAFSLQGFVTPFRISDN